MTSSRKLSALVLLAILCWTRVQGGVLLDTCLSDANCGDGLYCGNCSAAGAILPRCVRDEATALTNITSLPFNKVSWLVTHNSYAIDNFPSTTGARLTFTNQEDSITSQLNNGVRGLMLDTYDFEGDVWLCHSFNGACYNYTAFGPLLNTLNDVQAFLIANPSEIVTLILEDYVQAPNGLTKVFTAANLTQFWFPVASMPTNGADWPTIGTMIQNNWRLLVFTSKSAKQASEGIAYEWSFLNENQYGDDGMKAGNCTNRAESKPLNNTGASLILQNFFRTTPVEATSCKDNSDALYAQLPVCYAAAGNRWANFLAVDYYKKSTGGGSFQALDKLNGQMECGCNSPVSCQAQTISGQCPGDPSLAEYSPAFVPPPQSSPTGTPTFSGDGPNRATGGSSSSVPPSQPSAALFGATSGVFLPMRLWGSAFTIAIFLISGLT